MGDRIFNFVIKSPKWEIFSAKVCILGSKCSEFFSDKLKCRGGAINCPPRLAPVRHDATAVDFPVGRISRVYTAVCLFSDVWQGH